MKNKRKLLRRDMINAINVIIENDSFTAEEIADVVIEVFRYWEERAFDQDD